MGKQGELTGQLADAYVSVVT